MAVLLFVAMVCPAGPAHPAQARVQPPQLLSAQNERVPVSDMAWFLEDPSAPLDVAAAAARFEGMPANTRAPHVGMVRIHRGEALWMRIDAAADATAPKRWMLDIERPPLLRVRVFTPEGGQWVGSGEVGTEVPFSARPVDHRNFVFPVSIVAGATASFIVRVEGAGPTSPKATFWQPAALSANNESMTAFAFLYFGLVAGMLFYERLEQHVADRTRELREAQQKLLATARRAGMAEIATNVLHNVGNTLNSVNVAAELMRARLDQARSAGLSRAADLLESQQDLAEFFTSDERGRVFPRYLRELSDVLQREREELGDHLEHLIASTDHIKRVVATQQAYAGPSVMVERTLPGELFEDALRIAGHAAPGVQTRVVRQFADIAPVQLDKTRALQILINLVSNARQATSGAGLPEPVLTVGTQADATTLRFSVSDTGCGIPHDNLVQIFSHGFTTRPGGHGFGLHGCALAAGEMGGRLTVHSDGPGKGATFTLELPLVYANGAA